MEEYIFFSLEGIKVSNLQFIADELSFALHEVIGVEHKMIEPCRIFPTFCMMSGSFLMIFEDAFMFVGGFSIALGMFAWASAKTLYAVVIHTPEGKQQAITSPNSHDVTKVISALNTAIIHRD